MLRASERARDRSRRGLSRLGSFNRDSDDEASRESSGLHRRVCDTGCVPRHGEERSRRRMDGRLRGARLTARASRLRHDSDLVAPRSRESRLSGPE